MGSSISTAERWIPLRQSAGNTSATRSLCMDEKWTHLGSSDPFDLRNASLSAAQSAFRQRALLARLIGGELSEAETTSGRLLSAFGSIGSVLSAKPSALARILNNPDLVTRLSVTKAVVMEGMGESVRRVQFELADASLQQWIVGLFKGLRRERIHMALLDSDKQLISDEPLADGDLHSVAGNLRRIVRSGIEADASGVVLMHNHPSGNVVPSAADVTETRKIAHLLENLELRLEDHLIVSGNEIFSMRRARLI